MAGTFRTFLKSNFSFNPCAVNPCTVVVYLRPLRCLTRMWTAFDRFFLPARECKAQSKAEWHNNARTKAAHTYGNLFGLLCLDLGERVANIQISYDILTQFAAAPTTAGWGSSEGQYQRRANDGP